MWPYVCFRMEIYNCGAISENTFKYVRTFSGCPPPRWKNPEKIQRPTVIERERYVHRTEHPEEFDRTVFTSFPTSKLCDRRNRIFVNVSWAENSPAGSF